MNDAKKVISGRAYFTLAVALFALLHISIELLSGGVRAHQPLMREDLPAISNWWGIVVLPSLGWILFAFMEKSASRGFAGLSRATLFRLGGGFLYGGMLAGSFELGIGEQTPLYLLLVLFLAGIAYPIYRGELVLGFIMGMTYTFGAVLPTIVASIVALFSFVLHNAARFLVKKLRTQTQ